VFVFLNPKRAQFFGSVTAVVLKQPYKMYQSKEIDDIMTHAQEAIYKYNDTGKQQIGTRNEDEIIFMAKEAAKTYKTLNNFGSLSDNEIIIDAKEYWALHLKTLVKIGGKYMPVKSENADSIKTYSELINILYKFKSYLVWMHNKDN
jgi:hypothetical protein